MSRRQNALRPSLDIAGTTTPSSSLKLSEEPLGLGSAILNQSGVAASVTTVAGGVATITGLSGMSANSVGRFITLSGANSSGNNGTFRITVFNSSSSVNVANTIAVANDANNGTISWTERHPYSLEDDLNYIRTDRAAIKGVGYSGGLPTYTRPVSPSTNVPANLANIAGKTTDAKSLISDRRKTNVVITPGSSFISITDTGNLKHAVSSNTTGIPLQDGLDNDVHDATYVRITTAVNGMGLQVLSGIDIGKNIFGRTRAGSSSSPNSVEIEFRATTGYDLASSIPYVWELGQATLVDLIYGYREQLDQIGEAAFRSHTTNLVGIEGGSSSGITESEHQSLRQLIHFISEGPAEGFASGAYKEILPAADPFPLQITWWDSSLKLKKIVEKIIVRNSEQMPVTTTWKIYDTTGLIALSTITDTHSYSGIFEVSRTRVIS